SASLAISPSDAGRCVLPPPPSGRMREIRALLSRSGRNGIPVPIHSHDAPNSTPIVIDMVQLLDCASIGNLGGDAGLDRFDGRALREAFADGPDEEQVPIQVHTYFAES